MAEEKKKPAEKNLLIKEQKKEAERAKRQWKNHFDNSAVTSRTALNDRRNG